jgi:hypothetical protein
MVQLSFAGEMRCFSEASIGRSRLISPARQANGLTRYVSCWTLPARSRQQELKPSSADGGWNQLGDSTGSNGVIDADNSLPPSGHGMKQAFSSMRWQGSKKLEITASVKRGLADAEAGRTRPARAAIEKLAGDLGLDRLIDDIQS